MAASKSSGRLRLLGSGSALASAVALAALSTTAASAQSIRSDIPSIPSIEIPVPMEIGGPARGPIMQAPANDMPSVRSRAPAAFPTPIATPYFVERNRLTLDPPVLPLPQQNVAAPASVVPAQPIPIVPDQVQTTAVLPNVNAPATSMVTTSSTTSAPSPGDTDTNGINVRASANYFSSEIDFRPGTAVDVVDVLAAQAIINWTTFDPGTAGGQVTFLGAGGNLEFTSALGDYTVLNRVFTPTIDNAIRIDGAVTSNVLGGSAIGGNVWFYSPGGIVVGPDGSFNVGGLVLTSSNLNSIDAGGTELNFLGTAEPDTVVEVSNLARIDANQQGSYVALVAPRVIQDGRVSVDGSAAYVGAEQAQLTINNGLFDITVNVGTDDATGVSHSGTTTGQASQATFNSTGNTIQNADPRAIYMVAVPKNNALSMLVGGDIGYQPATAAAATPNGTIILSAGANVSSDGVLAGPTITIDKDNATPGASINVSEATFRANTTMFASDTIDLTQGNGQIFNVTSDSREDYELDVHAGAGVDFGTTGSGVISIAGDLILRAGDNGIGGDIAFSADTTGVKAGAADPNGPNANVSIGGNLTLDASGAGRDDFFTIRDNGGTGIGEDAVGGNITFEVSDGGSLSIDGNLILDASAQGGKGEVVSGNATAGDITFTIADSDTIFAVTGATILDAGTVSAGTGKIGGNGPAAEGADGIGGDVTVNLTAGSFSSGSLSINTTGEATGGVDDTVPQDNLGRAGAVDVNVTGGSHTFGSVGIAANSVGANSYDVDGNRSAGSAGRGTIDVTVSGTDTTLSISNDLNIDAQTSGTIVDPAGTVVSIVAQNTGSSGGGILVGDDIFINTSASDGSGTGAEIAGSISVLADSSNITFDALDFDAVASPSGDTFSLSGEGRDFQGGDITIEASNFGVISGRRASLSSSASGSDADAGDGTGGTIRLTADDGRIALTQSLFLTASGQGGSGINPDDPFAVGVGQGGSMVLTVTGGGGSMAFGSVSANTDGSIFSDPEGGFGFNEGNGGNGIAGDVTFNIEGGTFDAGSVTVRSDGSGGPGGDTTNLPASTASDVTVEFFGDTVDFGGFGTQSVASTRASSVPIPSPAPAAAMAGAPGTGSGGKGGNGVGGTVEFNLTGGTMTVTDLDVTADGVGGDGAFGEFNAGTLAGDAGDGIGGTATFNAIDGSLTVTNQLSVTARGNTEFNSGDGGFGDGVAGGAGGNAIGGTATFNLNGSATITAGDVLVSTDAYGGRGGSSSGRFDALAQVFLPGEDGGDGGSATGGDAVFNNVAGNISFATLTVSSDGEGGVGGDSFGPSTGEAVNDGGIGGAGLGGSATINLNQDDGSDPSYIVRALGTGGRGGSGRDGADGGDATGGIARLNVNDVAVNLTTATVDASATGGEGGFADGDGGNGGAGGEARGGTAILDVNGAAGVLTSDAALTVVAAATGGLGSNGVDLNFGIGGAVDAGDGGSGGNAEAGLVQIIARDGATATLLTNGSTNANASGGGGGGGGVDFVNFNDLGDGGDAGSATAGTVELIAESGGTLDIVGTGGPAIVSADAVGAEGGFGGSLTFGFEGPNGANGTTAGGEVALIARGAGSALTLVSDFQATANATGVSGTSSSQSTGADATGGLLSIEVDGGATITALGNVDLTANAIGADGLFAPGNADGGTVDIFVIDGTLALNDLSISLTGTGTDAGNDFNGTIGDAGSGTGGEITMDVGSAGVLDIQTFFAEISGFGGTGSDDGTNTTEGRGGAGTGGAMTGRFAGALNNLTSFTVQATGNGGNAGDAQDGADGASGGLGAGGFVDVEFSGTGPLLISAPDMFLYTFGNGGAGGAGGQGDMVVDAGEGGAGGNALGGEIRFAISGAGASLDLGGATTILDSGANAGTGGRGGSNFGGGTGGGGGIGGDADGGTTLIEAGSGSTLTLADGANIASNGTGGSGGQGGNVDMGSGGFAGTGGTGGVGTGGSQTLRATGGTIQGGDLQLTAVGFGGSGGIGGDDGLTVIGADGNGGDGIGGTTALEILDGSPGIITLGNVDLLANGAGGAGGVGGAGIGGLVTITDLSVDPAGLITLGSLDVDASGAAAIVGGGFVMSSGSGPITITNSMAINTAGDIIFDFDGDGQVTVGGTTQLNTDGNVAVTHTNNATPTVSIDVAGNFTSVSGGDFTSGTGSTVSSGNEMFVLAGGDISADDLRAAPFILLNARGSVVLNDAVAIGPQGLSNFGGIIIDAGLDTTAGVPLYDPNENVTITGTVQSYNDIVVRVGGSATFAAGSSTTADNALSVRSGDDIIIVSGATVAAANDPTSFINLASPFANGPNLSLLAGDITNLISVPNTPIASVAIGGIVNANGGAVILTGSAVDALAGTINASSIQADINDAPANGFAQSDDNGLLDANCLQGNVCFGNISADNRIEIGQSSNNGVIALLVEQGTVNAQDILITTRSDIVMGTSGIATALGASNQFSAISTEGDVNLLDAAITSDSIVISAAGSLLGTSSLTSANNIQIAVGEDVNAALIDTDGQLIDGTGGTFNYTVPGSINVGIYNLGDRTARIDAGNNISFGAINIDGNRDIRLTAATTGAGDVFLGTVTGAQDIFLRGDNISFTDLTSSQFIDFLTLGTITGGSLTSASIMTLEGVSIDVGDLDTGFITNINATAGDASTGNITSTSSVRIDAAGNVTTLNVSAAGGARMFAGGNIDAGTITTTGAVADIVFDANGTLDFAGIDGSRLVNLDGTAITGGDILAAAGVAIDGTSIGIGNVRSTGGFVTLTSTVGDVSTGDLTSDTLSVQVDSAANVNAGDISAAASGSITSAGNTIVGNITSGNNVTLNVDGNLTSGALDAQSVSPGMTISVLGDADIASANSNGLLTLTVDGTLTGGDFTSASLNRLTAGSIDITSAGSTGQALTVVTNLGDAIIGSTSSNNGTTVTAAGAVDVGDATAGTSVTLRGQSVALDLGDIGGNLTLDATGGDVSGTGAINVGGAIDLDATANIAVGSLDAQGGNFNADAGGTIGFVAASANGNVVMATTGAINGGDVTASGTADLTGGNIAVNDVGAANIDLTSGADILFDSLTSPNAITVTAANGAIGANTGKGDIDSGNDVTLTAESIALGDVTATGSVGASATNGNATFGTLDAATDITISATGTPTVANAISGGNTSITGASVAVNNGTIGGNLTLNATAGDIDGNGTVTVGGAIDFDATGNVGFGDLDAQGGGFAVDAGGAIDFTGATTSGDAIFNANSAITGGDVTAAGTAELDGGDIAVGNVDAANIALTSDTDILFDSLISPNAITVSALNGAIGANTGRGDVDSDGDITLTAQTINVGEVTSGGSVSADATAGDAAFVEVDAATDISISATGTPTVLIATSGGNTSITGASVALNHGTIGGNLTLNATAGDIDGNGAVTVGGAIDFDAAGNVGFGDLAAQGGDFTVDAGGDVAFTSATSSANVAITADGTVDGANVAASNQVDLTGRAITLKNVTTNGPINMSASGGGILVDNIISDDDAITLDAAGSITADHAEAGTDFNATAVGNVTTGLNSIITGGNILIVGDIIDLGNSSAGGSVNITGSQIDFVTLVAGAAADLETIDLSTVGLPSNGNGNITGVDLTAGPGASALTALGSIDISGNTAIGGSLTADAVNNINFGTIDVQGGNFIADAGGAISYGNVTGSADVLFTAVGAIAGDDILTAGAIQLDGGDIAVGDIAGSTITATSGADALFDKLVATGAVTVSAANGAIGINTVNGEILGGATVDLAAQAITVGDVSAVNGVTATASAGSITAGNVTTSGLGASIALSAAGATSDVSTGNTTTNGGDILVSSDRNIAVTSAATSTGTPTSGTIAMLAAGDVAVSGALSAGEDVAVRSLGNITLGTVTAGDDVVIEADGSITVDSATATGAGIDLFAVRLDAANAGQPNAIVFAAESLAGSNIALTSDADMTATGTLDAADDITVTATGTPRVGNAISGGNTSIFGASVALNSGTIGGNLTLNATAGDIDGTGAVTVGGAIDFDAVGNVGFGDLDAQGGDFSVDAGGGVAFTSAASSNDVVITSGGTIKGTDVTAVNQIDLTGSAIILRNTTAGGAIDGTTTGGDLAIDNMDSGGAIALGSAANINVDHAEAATDFIATAVGNVTTGLNSIITGGDIVISGDLIDLGNSSAGGSVDVFGGQIDFVTLTAGSTIDLETDIVLDANGGRAGNGNITGVDLTAGPGASALTAIGSINLLGDTAIGGNVDMVAAGDIFVADANVQGGDFTADAGGDINAVTVTASGVIDFLAGNSIGVSGNITSANGVNFTAIAGEVSSGNILTGGDVLIDAGTDVSLSDIALDLTSVTITAGGNVVFNDIITAQNVGIQSGGALDFANINAAGDVSGTAQDGINGQTIAADGSVALSGATTTLQSVAAGGNVTSQSLVGAATIDTVTSGGTIDIDAAGLADIGTATATFDLDIKGSSVTIGQANAGGTIDLESGGAGSVSAGALSAGADIRADAGTGGFTGTTLDADQAVIVFTDGGAQFTGANADDFVSVTGDGDVTATSITGGNGAVVDVTGSLAADTIAAGANGVADITATQGITIGTLSGVAATLQADAGAVAVTTDVAVTELVDATGTTVSLTALGDLQTTVDATNGGADITAGGNLDLQGVTATGYITVVSGGSTEVNGAPVITTSPTPISGMQGTQQVTSSGGNISFTVGGDLTVNAAVSAANDLTMDVNGLIDLQAVAAGQVINAQSGDITIGTSGALGRSDQTDTINIATDGDITLGGAGGAQGFELDNDEFSRVHSGGDVTISANGVTTGEGNMTVDDLAVAVGAGTGGAADGNIGQGGSFSLSAGNDIGVIGNGVVGNASADTALNIDAGNLLSIDPETGNLRVEDANSAITGSINLAARAIVATSPTAQADIAGAAVTDIDTRLGQNDGAIRDDGVIQGSTVTFTVDDALLIQNTGEGTDFGDRRGFVADTVTINSSNPDVAIVINGIVDGVAGIDTIPLADISADFDPASTINGCLIANPASCAAVIDPVDPANPTTNDPVQDLIEEQIPGTTPADGSIGTILVELREDPERELDPLIDEPVTGAGNEDLWVGEEDEGEADVDCDEPSGVCPTEGELEPAE
ncbi:hypothetical protein QWY75_01765 [Pontixanthobacter aestiaquae]|uniref:Autotransporter domain-containing protein n=1 Tax=Pontixanthobacter aestiaquae TaxID=1509367 RepID=A0A844Z5Z8_9SPHN|nr:hypothetical protein [Pontixanthobacter aestiaquae]MDN3644928.1 hypothetical protein [Pontixanthobacter aestiaquae]MXO84071.1 hypothetical protein [Pontixanthobacter aestiaquae]